MTPAEAAQVVLVLQAAYPGARMTEETSRLYEALLSDLEVTVVRNAVARLVCTNKFLPTIAEIREVAADAALGPSRHALEAWSDVTLAIRRHGYVVGQPKFDDPLVAECVKIMGWRQLCLADTPEAADRARFAELYAALQRKERQFDVSEPGRLLPGGRAPAQLPANVRELSRKVGR